MSDALLLHIRKFVSLSEAEEQLITSALQYRAVKKKGYLLEEGQRCTANYFIVKGCCRMYFITEAGTEQIVQFGIDNWWITDYLSFDSGKVSGFYIQAVEPSEIVQMDKSVQEELLHRVPQLERYFRVILQRAFGAAQMRIQYIYGMSAEERYRHFNKLFPEFVQRVPQYMLASYLGFTPEFLSKVRAKRS